MIEKITKDDLGAIVSRMDAQTVILIELLSELAGKDKGQIADIRSRYTGKYDVLSKRFRKDIVS